jgi:hypothetical protein
METSVYQEIGFDSTRYVTVRAGQFVATDTAHISGKNLGNIHRLTGSDYYSDKIKVVSLAVTAGDSITYLQYRAHGTCIVLLRDTVVDADPCPDRRVKQFRLISEPQTEQWLHVRRSGLPLGWLLITPGMVNIVRN